MKNINSLSKYSSLENFALDQTEQFLRPRTFLDSIYLLILVFWLITSTLFAFQPEFRVTLFLVALGLFVLIPIYVRLVRTKELRMAATSVNRAMKAVVFLLLIDLFTGQVPPTFHGLDGFIAPLTYAEFERLFTALMLPAAVFLGSFSFTNLQLGYDFYLSRILKGIWYSCLVLFVFRNIYLFSTELILQKELFVLIGFAAFIAGTLLPRTPLQLSMSLGSILEQYSVMNTRLERFRDACFTGGLLLVLLLWLPNWIISSRDLFSYLSLIGIIFGIILSLAPREKSPSRFASLVNSVSGVGREIDPSSQLASRVQNFARDINRVEFNKPETVYTIPTGGLTLVSKGRTKVSAKHGTIAVPTVTEKGTAVVLMGKSEMQTDAINQETQTQEVEGTTTIWLPPDEWEDIRVKLNPKDMNELTDQELRMAGIGDVMEVFNKAETALNNLKQWRGPRGLFSSVLDPTPSKYAIRETEDYSLVRLPGIYVFESSDLELVNILGGAVKVIEMKGVGSFVRILGGLITVLETKEYSFVQTPVVSVVETPQGEMVRIMGIDIQEGERFNLEEARKKIIRDQERFNALFSERITSIFQEEPNVILAELKGEIKGWIIGEEESLEDTSSQKGLATDKRKRKRTPPSPPSPPTPPGIKQSDRRRSIDITWRALHKPQGSQFSDEFQGQTEGTDEKIMGIDEALEKIQISIDKIDEKFLANEIDSEKHSDMISRLKAKEKKLLKKRGRLTGSSNE